MRITRVQAGVCDEEVLNHVVPNVSCLRFQTCDQCMCFLPCSIDRTCCQKHSQSVARTVLVDNLVERGFHHNAHTQKLVHTAALTTAVSIYHAGRNIHPTQIVAGYMRALTDGVEVMKEMATVIDASKVTCFEIPSCVCSDQLVCGSRQR